MRTISITFPYFKQCVIPDFVTMPTIHWQIVKIPRKILICKIDTNQSFESFLNRCHEKILQNSRTKYIQYDRKKKGFILTIGSRRSPNYYRVYENNQQIWFELEMKSSRVQSVQDFLFNHQIPEFEHILTKHFYNHSNKILVLDQVYIDWLIKYLKRKAGC